MQHEVERGFSKRVGAVQTVVVRAHSLALLMDALGIDEHKALITASLCGQPVVCPDLRELAKSAHDEGKALVVDNSVATSFGASPARRGAQVVFELLPALKEVQHTLVAVSVSRDVEAYLSGFMHKLESCERASFEELQTLAAQLSNLDQRRRAANDEAQVVASYLVCHPAVCEVRYPGLKQDPSFKVASALLRQGFGPWVDYRCRAHTGAEITSWQRFTARGGAEQSANLALEDSLKAYRLTRS